MHGTSSDVLLVQGRPAILGYPPKSGGWLFLVFVDMLPELLQAFRAPFPDSSEVQLSHIAPQNGQKSKKEKPLIRIEMQIFFKSCSTGSILKSTINSEFLRPG